jgi:hypothetical protein
MRARALFIALGVVALSATRMEAQACAGTAAFSSGPVRLGAGLATTEGAKSYGVLMAVGSKSGAFAGGNISRADYSDSDLRSSTQYGVGAGYAIDLNPAHTVQFCPHAGFAYQSGPDFDLGTSTMSTSGHAFSLGGSFGGIVPVSPTLDVVPFAGGSVVMSRATANLDGDTQSDSQNYAEIDVGAGFVVNRTLTLQPSASLPVGIEGAKPSFQISFSLNVGSAKP